MSTPFDRALALASKTTRKIAGQTVTYSRSSASVALTVTAVVGTTNWEVESGETIINIQSRDFLIEAASLVVGGEQIVPKVNDRITQMMGDKTCVYLVSQFGAFPCYSYSDPAQKELRIHTRLISES